jgi:lysophospholipid acyltransferase (LPLAT)-like uncharacterized protein
MLKRLKYAIMLSLLPPVVNFFLLLLKATVRIEHVNREAAEPLMRGGKGYIACFWHGRLLAMPFAYRGCRIKVLISRHQDGEFIARIVGYFGIGAVRGSSRRGAMSSARQILGELDKGTGIAITPDGPKGPRHHIKQGVIEMARITQRPIVPVTYSASRKKVFSSWDRLVLPYPFSKVLFLWGNPMYVSHDLKGDAIEAARKGLENTLVSLTETADAMACGR